MLTAWGREVPEGVARLAPAPKRGPEIILGLDRFLWPSAWALRKEALDLREVLSSLRPTTEELHELARFGF